MKIAIIHFHLERESGDTRMLYAKARELAKAGHAVQIYTGKFDARAYPEMNRDLAIHSLAIVERRQFFTSGLLGKINERLVAVSFQNRSVRAVKKILPKDFDILDCQNDYSYQLGAFYKRVNSRTRVIWTMNNCPFYHVKKEDPLTELLSRMAAWWEKQKVKQYLHGIDRIIVNDDEQRRAIEEVADASCVALMHIPVDFDAFFEKPRAIRARGAITLLGVGSLSPVRKFEDIITAAAELRKEKYDARVKLVCRDYWSNNQYRAMLLKLVHTLGIEGSVDFYFSGVEEKELHEIQKTSDVFIFPNHRRIWGMAAFEAMAAGLPLVVSDTTSVAEVLRNDENAFFVSAGRPREIADKIKYLIEHPEESQRIAGNGQRFVEKNLTWAAYIKTLLR